MTETDSKRTTNTRALPRASALLTVAESYAADAAAAREGISGETLMEAAGRAVADAVRARWAPRPVVVLCGPGNNGGDGFVAARHLTAAGWPVTLALLGAREALKGDAATMAGRFAGAVLPLAPEVVAPGALVIDALFGAGLSRAIEGAPRAALEAAAERAEAVIAVDVPSGIDGDTGAVLGFAAPAALTVTFFRRKPGHLLLPGRTFCGEVVVADIGIPEATLDAIAPKTYVNGPALWGARFPWPRAEDHKYRRGHALVVGGPIARTGAARLAARAALRAGAGLVTVATSREALPVYAAALTAVMTAVADDEAAFAALLADPRRNAVLVGPGCGVTPETRARVLAALREGKACVLDADALTVFENDPEQLFDTISSPCLLTPHEGEFVRLFGALEAEGGKPARARAAARASGAAVLLKGADTVIADEAGFAVVNDNAPPTLATAGAGDALAGFALGLLAQGMDPFDAGCAAAWLHGAAAARLGPGLIAEDLAEALPGALERLAAALGRRAG